MLIPEAKTYTYKTSKNIPDIPGIYAWFLPLYLFPDFSDNIETYIQLIRRFHLYDSEQQRIKTTNFKFNFKWEGYNAEISADEKIPLGTETRNRWDTMITDSEQKIAFSEALLVSSIIAPPLYVGKANDLKRRYFEHIDSDINLNLFKSRFLSFCKLQHLNIGRLNIGIDELLFHVIPIDIGINSQIDKSEKLNELLEQVLMKIIGPPFSIR